MNNINDTILLRLRELGLVGDEAKVYLALLEKPCNHLQVSRMTGVNRTKVYRIADKLGGMGLIARLSDDRGTFLVASDPSSLEAKLIEQEERLKEHRKVLKDLVVDLAALRAGRKEEFIVQTYEGYSGFKQMAWHELRSDGELLSLGNGTIEEQVGDLRWARRHREKQVESGYKTLEIINWEYNKEDTVALTDILITDNKLYECRVLSPELVMFDGQTTIYNNTVAIYHWKHNKKVGLEMMSRTYADMMRQIFYNYWAVAELHGD
ncbi:MAG TPA: helix-turn-helix domain-containing protein [Candidatus Saccharimonadales bacterium]